MRIENRAKMYIYMHADPQAPLHGCVRCGDSWSCKAAHAGGRRGLYILDIYVCVFCIHIHSYNTMHSQQKIITSLPEMCQGEFFFAHDGIPFERVAELSFVSGDILCTGPGAARASALGLEMGRDSGWSDSGEQRCMKYETAGVGRGGDDVAVMKDVYDVTCSILAILFQ